MRLSLTLLSTARDFRRSQPLFWSCSRNRWRVRLLRHRSQGNCALRSLLLSTAARDSPDARSPCFGAAPHSPQLSLPLARYGRSPVWWAAKVRRSTHSAAINALGLPTP